MATVTGMTAAAMQAIRDGTVVSAAFDSANHLILTRYDGTQIDAGTVGSATTTAPGQVELATSAETITGTDTARAVTPAGLAAIPGYKVQIINLIGETALPASYPSGISLMDASDGSGWSLNNGYGTVMTANVSAFRCEQTFYAGSGGTTPPKIWIRTANSVDGGGGWTAWSQTMLMVELTATNFTQATVLANYPPGQSRLYYTTLNSSAWDFGGKAGEVLTFRNGNDFGRQTFTQHVGGSTAATATWTRTATAAGGWSKWEVTTTADSMALIPARMASGSTTIAAVSDTRVTQAVTFPSGRFTSAPRTFVTVNSTTPDNVWCAVNNITATGCTITLYRTDTVSTSVYWFAVLD